MPRTAVLIPCLNEAAAITDVVRGFGAALPGADIYVYDNGSEDDTAALAAAAGAIVRREPRRGKGTVIARMFADVDAELYVIADGDGTYDAASAPKMVETLLTEGLDMVVGTRAESTQQNSYRPGHRIGNRLLTFLVMVVFGRGFTDMLSGYRCLSRRFVKSFPALSRGFEIETELTIHALQLHLPCAEIPTPYYERPRGGASKLRTLRDGLRITKTIVRLFKDYRPLFFFGALALALAALSLGIGLPVIIEYLDTGLVPRLPTAVLAASTMICALLAFGTGLILDSVARGMSELRRLSYLLQDPTERPSPNGRHASLDRTHDKILS